MMYLIIYAIGFVISTIAFLEDGSPQDVLSSAAIGVLWPAVVPACIIRKVIR